MVTIANFREDQYPIVSGTRCIKIYIPDDDAFKSLLAGLLALPGVETNYQNDDPDKAAQLAQQWINAYVQSDWNECETPMVIPVGTIVQFGSAFLPDGWLYCDGAEVAKADYPALWAAIVTTWGTSSDPDMFVLPDMRERSPYGFYYGGGGTKALGGYYGAENVTLTEAQMPVHKHKYGAGGGSGSAISAQIGTAGSWLQEPQPETANAGSGQAHTNLHPVAVCGVIIYAGV